MIDECDLVALLIDLPDLGLVRGDVGTVAMIHGRGEGFEIEFVNAGGRTIGVETLLAGQVKKITESEAILHVSEDGDTFGPSVITPNYEIHNDDNVPRASKIVLGVPEDIAEPSTPLIDSLEKNVNGLLESLVAQESIDRESANLKMALFLFQNNWYSLGKAGKLAGLHPAQFQQELANRQLPVHYDCDDYEQDIMPKKREL